MITRALILLAVIVGVAMPQMAKMGHCAVDMSIIATIESGGNARAYNKSSGAVGMYQITHPVIHDYNVAVNGVSNVGFELRDMYNPEYALMVADWYMNYEIPRLLKYFNIKDTTDNRLWCYNAGIGYCKRGIKPLETRNYIKKYNRLERGGR